MKEDVWNRRTFTREDLRPGSVLRTMRIGLVPPLVLSSVPMQPSLTAQDHAYPALQIVCVRSCVLLTHSGLERCRLTLFSDGELLFEPWADVRRAP